MVKLLGLVISIGLVDSLNPSTIAPALFIASGKHPRRQVSQFTLSVFVVYLAGGALLTLGPGQLLRSAIPDFDVQRTVRYIAEVVAGVLLLIGAALIWLGRHRLAARRLPQSHPKRRSSAVLGASITAVELPTAFPYFAAIAAIAGSGLGTIRQLVLLVIFNVCFVLPLIGIVATLTFAGDRSAQILGTARDFFDRRWPELLAILIALVGLLALALGVTGLAAGVHGRVGKFFRRVRGRLPHL